MRSLPALFPTLAVTLLSTLPALAQDAPKPTPTPTPIPVSVPQRKEPVSYAKEVADVLAAKCVGCHSEVLAENKLNLEEVSTMLKGGKRGPALVPGKADESLLFRMAAHRVDPVMPPRDKKDAKPLTSEELGLIKLWIDAGAKDDSDENAEPATPIQLGELPPGVQPINAVDLTADGTRVACGRANVVQVYDVDSGLEILSLGGHKDLIQSLRFSPDGRRLAAGSYQVVTLWNVPTGGLKATMTGHTEPVKALAVLPDGTTVVSGGLDKRVRFWNAGDGKPVRDFAVPAQALSLAVSPDGKRLAVGGSDNIVRVVDAGDGKELSTLKGHTGPVNDVAFLPGGRRIVSVSADGTGRIWRLPEKDGDVPADPLVVAGDQGALRAVAVTPDGQVVVTAGESGTVRLWDADWGTPVARIESSGAPVIGLAVSPKGDRLLTGSADKTARLYDLTSRALLTTLAGHLGPVNSVAFSPGGDRLATAGGEGGIKVWDVATGQGVIAFGHTAPKNEAIQPVHRVVFTAEGGLVSASADKTLKGWAFEGRWSEMKPLGPHAFRVLALDFNPDGTLLAAGGGEPSRSGEIRVWEVGKGLPVRTLDGLHSDTVFGLRFSPDGTRLASAGADKFMKVTRVADGKEVKSFEGHTHHVLAVDWKSDGKQIVTGGADNVIKLWEFESGEQVRTFQAAGKQVTAVRWVPGKPDVAGASGDKLVKFWNADNGSVNRTFQGPGDYVFGVATSADGSRIAAGGADSALFVWNGQNGQVVRKIEPPARAAPKVK
jgi:WD40 repeat protein